MKIISFILGLALLAGIIWAGYYTVEHASFVIWFGVITAIVSPLSFELVYGPFRADTGKILKSLAKAAEVEKMIQQAEDTQTKIALLEAQQRDLDKLIAYESKRRTLVAEREIYVINGQQALNNIQKVDEQILLLTGEKLALPEHLQPLAAELDKPDQYIVGIELGNRKIFLRRSSFELVPLYGGLLFDLFRAVHNQINKLERSLFK
jgi:hypothetical protein